MDLLRKIISRLRLVWQATWDRLRGEGRNGFHVERPDDWICNYKPKSAAAKFGPVGGGARVVAQVFPRRSHSSAGERRNSRNIGRRRKDFRCGAVVSKLGQHLRPRARARESPLLCYGSVCRRTTRRERERGSCSQHRATCIIIYVYLICVPTILAAVSSGARC